MTRLSPQLVARPDVVEMHDVTAQDPKLLVHLKATRNSVPVPRHWCFKRKYLQGKRGIEKPPFELPDFIKRTGIQEMREALQEKVGHPPPCHLEGFGGPSGDFGRSEVVVLGFGDVRDGRLEVWRHHGWMFGVWRTSKVPVWSFGGVIGACLGLWRS